MKNYRVEFTFTYDVKAENEDEAIEIANESLTWDNSSDWDSVAVEEYLGEV